ncbi:D-alanyl-D-alanine carboxypeptidase family protein [Marininema halotolerans]|uniref:serine-type D-Ala-D-Ala carboxypeptidase n=1 Tax=Marininema halotolerans TaxID=1155944 RepID=A0A1I6TS98_9BACL|nr:D-alanyl-D-alanine carboxypeptidase family protein [Marininema halotolerans]SFS91877.1 D-alanyl-D-alanine carboxypeptidase [Marininema halotolerans]
MRYPAILIAVILTLLFCTPGVHAERGEESPPELAKDLSAHAAAVIDVSSNRILFEKEAQRRMRIASLTKIMTAIVAIENADVDQKVTVSPGAVGVEGSSIYLKQGDQVPLHTLLYGLMLRSGNDAAVAIAESVGGSVPGFVYMMNEKAAYLGLKGTHFENPHGLDSDDHYSTAEDMARLTAYALKNPIFKEIVSTPLKTVPWPGEDWKRTWRNKNKMLRLYPGADGVKTGYTKLSKRTLVSSATRDGRQLVTVTLDASDDWHDSMQLLDYGFTHYQPMELVQKGEKIAPLKRKKSALSIIAEKSFIYPLTEEERKTIEVKPLLTYPLAKINKEGLRIGSGRIYLNGKLIGSVPLTSGVPEEESALQKWFQVIAEVFGRGER